jgi:hypothetical protein
MTQPTKPKAPPKVAREVAEAEFDRMCDARRIETDTSELPDDEKAEFADIRGSIVRMIMRGALVVAESGDPTYTPVGAPALTFHPATGATLMALETHPGGKSIANMMAALTEMTRTDPGTFAKLAAPDAQACSRIGKLFLADR